MRTVLFAAALVAILASAPASAAEKKPFPYTEAELAKLLERAVLQHGHLRDPAIESLAAIGKAAVPGLVKLLEDPDDGRSFRAANALGRLGPNGAAAGDALVRFAKKPHKDWGRLDRGFRALQGIGAGAVPTLTKALADGDVRVRRQAMWALGRMGAEAKPALAALVRALNDKDRQIQQSAADAIGLMGPDAKGAVRALIAAAGKPNMAVPCIRALGRIGPDARPGLGIIGKFVNTGGRRQERMASAAALARIVPGNPMALNLLAGSLKNPKPDVRRSAVEGFGEVGPLAAPAMKAILPLLDDKDRGVKRATIIACGKIGPAAKGAAEKIAQGLPDKNDGVSLRAVEVLAQMGKASLPEVMKHFASNDKRSRCRAAETIEKMGVEARSVIPELIAGLGDPDGWFSGACARALGAMGKDAAPAADRLATCFEALKRNQNPRSDFVRALGQIGASSNAVIASLAETATSVKSRNSRLAAVQSLGDLGASAKPAVPALQRALWDDFIPVRKAAADALASIGVAQAAGSRPEPVPAAQPAQPTPQPQPQPDDDDGVAF